MIELKFSPSLSLDCSYEQGWIKSRKYSSCLVINLHDIWTLLNTNEGQERMRGGGGAISAKNWNQNFSTSLPSMWFIYVGHWTVRSYFSHAETVHRILLFDLSPFTSWSQPETKTHFANIIQGSKAKEKGRRHNIWAVKSRELNLPCYKGFL